MATFPKLKTNAIAQYPVSRREQFQNQTVRFVDGSEQRYRDSGSARMQWEIQFSDLEQPPLTYAEARKFYENAISKFAPYIKENVLKGKPRYMLGKFAKSLDQAIQGAAKQAGVEDQYVNAMKAYHKAAQFQSAASKVGQKGI